MANRRGFLGQLASLSGGLFVGRKALAGQQDRAGQHVHDATSNTEPGGDAVLIETADLPKLAFNLVDGAKEST